MGRNDSNCPERINPALDRGGPLFSTLNKDLHNAGHLSEFCRKMLPCLVAGLVLKSPRQLVTHPAPQSRTNRSARKGEQGVSLSAKPLVHFYDCPLDVGRGPAKFAQRFRNIAVDKSRMIFREEYVKGGYIGKEQYPGCLDRNYSIGDRDPSWWLYGGFDPAVGIKAQAKFCAHITLAAGSCDEHERCYWVVDLKRDQMTLPQQADYIIRIDVSFFQTFVHFLKRASIKSFLLIVRN